MNSLFSPLSTLARALLDALIPPLCWGCEEAWTEGAGFCSPCADALQKHRLPLEVCRICGMPMERRSCFRCFQFGKPFAFRRARASFYYAGMVKTLMRKGKYGGYPALLLHLAERTLLDWPLGAEAVTFVPGNPERTRERGYEPSRILARFVAKTLELPFLDVLASRKGPSQAAQTSHEARIQNARGRLTLRGEPSLPSRVLLVDDIITTGATLHEASRVLRTGGVQEVEVWTLASEVPSSFLPEGLSV